MNFELIKAHVWSAVNDSSGNWSIRGGNVIIDGISYKPTPWRDDRNLNSLHYLSVESASVAGLCSYKATRIEPKTADIDELIYCELDICRWLTDDEIASVYALSNSGKTMSLMLKTKKGILCAIDIATTLSEETSPIIKHEITGTEGMISDRCINEHIPSKDIYVFEDSKKDPTTYIDIDLYVTGLSPEETYTAENIIKLIESRELREAALKNMEKLLKCTEAIKQSIEIGDVVRLEEKA